MAFGRFPDNFRIADHTEAITPFKSIPMGNSNKVVTVPGVSDSGSFGFGVRVIANGAWPREFLGQFEFRDPAVR